MCFQYERSDFPGQEGRNQEDISPSWEKMKDELIKTKMQNHLQAFEAE